MIRHLRKDEAMSTYASRHNRYRSTARDAKLWPLVVTAVMVLIAFGYPAEEPFV